MYTMFNFCMYQVLFSTLNITTLTRLCKCSRPFYVCVLLCPAGMVAGEWVCVCACWFVFCLYVDGGCSGGGWGFGRRGNKPVPGRKTAFFCPLCFPSSPSLPHPHPQQPPSAFMPLIHLLCDDAPPAVGGCILTKHKKDVCLLRGSLNKLKDHLYLYLADPNSLKNEAAPLVYAISSSFSHILHHFIEFWQSFELLCIWCVLHAFTVPWMCL